MNVSIIHIYNDSRLADPYIVKQIAKDSSYIAVGYKVNAPGSNQALGYISKVSKTGQLLWEREYYYKDQIFNYFADFQPTQDGGFIITGATNGDTSQDIWLVKLDSLGLLDDSLTVNSGTILANSNTNIIQAYPNPVQHQLNIKVFFKEKLYTPATITIYNMQGKILQQETLPLQQGKAHYTIDVHNLPQGNYIAVVQAGAELLKQKFVKQ